MSPVWRAPPPDRAVIDQASVIQRILRHLGLPTEVSEPGPGRAPPLPLDTHALHADAEVAALDSYA